MNKCLILITTGCLWLTLAYPKKEVGEIVNLDSLWGVWNDKSQPDTNRLKAMNNNINDIRNAGGWKTLRMVEIYSQIDEEKNKETSQSIARRIATGR